VGLDEMASLPDLDTSSKIFPLAANSNRVSFGFGVQDKYRVSCRGCLVLLVSIDSLGLSADE